MLGVCFVHKHKLNMSCGTVSSQSPSQSHRSTGLTVWFTMSSKSPSSSSHEADSHPSEGCDTGLDMGTRGTGTLFTQTLLEMDSQEGTPRPVAERGGCVWDGVCVEKSDDTYCTTLDTIEEMDTADGAIGVVVVVVVVVLVVVVTGRLEKYSCCCCSCC